MSAQSYDLLAEALRGLRERMGETVFADRRRLASLLFDAAPDAKREVKVIGTAVEEGVAAALTGSERHLLGLEMDRQAGRLEATGLQRDLALQVVRVLAYALDLGPLPSVYGVSEPAAAGVGSWAGVSQPVAQGSYAPPPAPAYAPPPPAYQPPPAPQPSKAGLLDRLPFDRKYLIWGAPLVVAAGLAAAFLDKGQNPAPPVTPVQQGKGYAGELTDHGVAAKGTLESNVGTPTPLTIPVGRRITTTELQKLVADDPSALLVDVLADPHDATLKGAVYLPIAGYPGTTADNMQGQVAAQLKRVAADKPDRPMVFFCLGAICWESYNAVLRAGAAGYRNLYWYRGGLASWREAGLPMQPLQSQQQPQPPQTGGNAYGVP